MQSSLDSKPLYQNWFWAHQYCSSVQDIPSHPCAPISMSYSTPIPAVDEGHYYTELVLPSTDKSYYNFSTPAVDEGQCTEQVLPSTGCYHSQWYSHLPCTAPPVDGGPCVCTNLVPLSTKPLLPSLLLPSAIECQCFNDLNVLVVDEGQCTAELPSCFTEYYLHNKSCHDLLSYSMPVVDEGQCSTELVLPYYNHLSFSTPAVDEGQCTEQVLPSTHKSYYNHPPFSTPKGNISLPHHAHHNCYHDNNRQYHTLSKPYIQV